MSAFSEQDKDFFFGQEQFIDSLERAVQSQPVVAVIGPSGCGKSSVVFAGLLPRLRKSGSWLIESFRPKSQPFDELSFILVHQLEPELGETRQLIEAADLTDALQEGKLNLQQVASRIAERQSGKLLLVVDQFEELYTLCRDSKEQQHFIDALLTATDQNSLTLILTLRADFYGYVLSYRPFKDTLQQFPPQLMSSMNREELQAAIEKPAQKLYVQLEANLTQRILDDVGKEPGNLPLLEFALAHLWERQQNKELIHRAYDEIGGIKKALANHAEQVYSQLSEMEQKQAQRIFLQLVHPGEGTEDTRRLATRAEVGEENWDLVTTLADYKARLVVTGRNEKTEEETVEVVHEALIREWQRLQDWVVTDRSFRTWQERLRTAMRQWEASVRDDGALLRGVPLAEAENWLQKRQADLSQAEQTYIVASAELRTREQGERERQETERIEAQIALNAEREASQTLAKAQQKARRTIRVGFAVLAVTLVLSAIASAFAGTAFKKLKEAQEGTKLEQQGASALRQFEDIWQVEALLLAMQGGQELKALVKDGRPLKDYPTTSPLLALQTILNNISEQNRFERQGFAVMSVSFSPDGQHLLAGLMMGEGYGLARLWDVSGKLVAESKGGRREADGVMSAIFSPDGKRIATVELNGTVTLWNTSWQEIVQWKSPNFGGISSVSFSPDGQRLATAGDDDTVRLWNLAGKQIAQWKGHQDKIHKVSFSPDGQTLATAGNNGTVRLWDLLGNQQTQLNRHQGAVLDVSFSPDGQRIATAGNDSTVRLWNRSGQQVVQLNGHRGPINRVVFSPSGQQIATAGQDGIIKLWLPSGQQIARLNGHQATVVSVNFSPDGQKLASGGGDGTLRIWNLSAKQLARWKGHQDRVNSLSFSPDGQRLATAGKDGTASLWDLSGKQITQFSGFQGEVYSLSFSRDGRYLVTADGLAKIWNLAGKQLARFDTKDFRAISVTSITNAVLSPNEQQLAILGTAEVGYGGASLLNLLDKKLVDWESKQNQGIESLSFSPDGKWIATASQDGTVGLWNYLGQLIKFWNGHQGEVSKVIFSSDGQRIATAGKEDGIVRLWDRSGLQVAQWETAQGPVHEVLFSQDGQQIATAGKDGTIRLWNLSGQQIAQFYGYRMSFNPNGQQMAIGKEDGTVEIWSVANLDKLLDQGCVWLKDYFVTHPDALAKLKVCESK